MDNEELKKMGISSSKNIEEQKIIILNKIYLKRISIYPDNKDEFAVFDYTIKGKSRQFLITVWYDIEDNIIKIEKGN